ncbi:MAG: glycoside hydrolase family 97 N-terminal domain-containing protein, partial [Chitinophagaceae bacterium]
MKRLRFKLIIILVFVSTVVSAQKAKSYQLSSPGNNISVSIEVNDKLQWSVKHKGQTAIAASAISLQLTTGEVLGSKPSVSSAKTNNIRTSINAINYKKKIIQDNYNQVTISCKGDYGIIFRAYDDGVAYRFFTKRKAPMEIKSEEANFNFDSNYKCLVPYVRDLRGKEQYIQSFEALYTDQKLSQVYKDSIAFGPVLVDIGQGKKVVILDADLEEYPGMFFKGSITGTGLQGAFAPYALEEKKGGFNNLNEMVPKRADFIAKVEGTRHFPWRAVVISEKDADLLNNDMVQKLASPSRIADVSWIKPGKAAWEWWNARNISHVDFKAGLNNATYNYYIDFAAANNLEYVVVDAGWSDNLDLMKLNAQLNLEELIAYARQKKVDLILWASWSAIAEKMEEAFAKYSAMGVKGFKIDFLDRDDQKIVSDIYKVSKRAADYKLVLDYHGMYKPTG